MIAQPRSSQSDLFTRYHRHRSRGCPEIDCARLCAASPRAAALSWSALGDRERAGACSRLWWALLGFAKGIRCNSPVARTLASSSGTPKASTASASRRNSVTTGGTERAITIFSIVGSMRKVRSRNTSGPTPGARSAEGCHR
jgi:hypothetical protein